jgi:hypothetical protein
VDLQAAKGWRWRNREQNADCLPQSCFPSGIKTERTSFSCQHMENWAPLDGLLCTSHFFFFRKLTRFGFHFDIWYCQPWHSLVWSVGPHSEAQPKTVASYNSDILTKISDICFSLKSTKFTQRESRNSANE